MDSSPVSSTRPGARNDVEARLAQVEAILAVIAQTVSAAERRSTRPQDDPVGLTQALHPRASRHSRTGAQPRRAGSAGLIETRFVLFDGSRPPEPRR